MRVKIPLKSTVFLSDVASVRWCKIPNEIFSSPGRVVPASYTTQFFPTTVILTGCVVFLGFCFLRCSWFAGKCCKTFCYIYASRSWPTSMQSNYKQTRVPQCDKNFTHVVCDISQPVPDPVRVQCWARQEVNPVSTLSKTNHTMGEINYFPLNVQIFRHKFCTCM